MSHELESFAVKLAKARDHLQGRQGELEQEIKQN